MGVYKLNPNTCYLCGGNDHFHRPGQVRDKPEINVLECKDCGLVFLSDDRHISEEHYAESGMHEGAPINIDGWLNDTVTDDERRFEFVKERITNSTLLDFGCGAGGFLQRVKNFTVASAGVELELALQPSYTERGLNVHTTLENAHKEGKKWDVITAFHVVEHLSDPKKVLMNLSGLLADSGEMIVEVPNANDALLTLYESENFQKFTYWSQHLFLFTDTTLRMLIKQSGLHVKWVKHIQRYPISNHLQWLAQGKPGGHKKWHFLDDDILNAAYTNKLASLGLTDTIIMGVSK